MRLENTCFSNHQLVIDEHDNPVAVQINGVIAFRLHDRVKVTGDSRGYICPGIKSSGYGQIISIRRDDTDHFYGVRMDNGEFGYMKDSRMRRC